MKAPTRIGILGGTFDPVHNGHLAIAEAARGCLGLDRVVFIPAGRPWLKARSVGQNHGRGAPDGDGAPGNCELSALRGVGDGGGAPRV